MQTLSENPIVRQTTFGQTELTGSQLHIALGTDDSFMRGAGVAIVSVIMNNPKISFVFHIFTTNLDPDNISRIKEIAETHHTTIHIYIINDEFFSWTPPTNYSKAIFYRLIIPLTLSHLSRVLYIDSDIVCLNNITELFHSDLGENIAAVTHDAKRHATKQIALLKLTHNCYFNSGVILMDIARWNKYDISSKTIQVLANSKGLFSFPDQDALNIVLDGKVKYIEEKWNYRYDMEKMTTDIPPNTVILHYTAKVKPWRKIARHKLAKKYQDYARQSPWRDLPLEEPDSYKDMRYYAKLMFNEGQFLEGIRWIRRYLKTKTKVKLLHKK